MARRLSYDQRSFNPGRPPASETEAPNVRDVAPPTDEELLPKTLVIQPAGSVTIPDWDIEAHALKDNVISLFKQLSNRPRENGVRGNEYLALECRVVKNETGIVSPFARRHGGERITLGDAFDVLRVTQGTTARELTLKMFSDAPAPPVFEPRVRSILYRLKAKGWAHMRYDERGLQRWYAVDIDGPLDEWDARARAVAYTLVDLLGGKPRDYVRQVDALCTLMDAQGERVIDPKAWLVKRERPF